jgi:hypothetical protein
MDEVDHNTTEHDLHHKYLGLKPTENLTLHEQMESMFLREGVQEALGREVHSFLEPVGEALRQIQIEVEGHLLEGSGEGGGLSQFRCKPKFCTLYILA